MARVVMILLLASVLTLPAAAQQGAVKIGFVVDITGGASSLGVPERNTVQLYQEDMGTVQGPTGPVKIQYLITDGESDPTRAVLAVKRLMEEERVAAVVCCTTTPASLAIIASTQAARVPTISLAASVSIIEPVEQRYWVFKTPQTDRLMIDVITSHMVKSGIKRVAFIGFDDAFGQGGLVELDKIAPQKGVEIAAREAFARAATDVSTQVTRAMGRNPQAILIWAIPPGANVANRNVRELGHTLPVYQSHGVANKTFLDLGGASVEGVLFPAGKVLIAEQLSPSDKQRPVLVEYARRYESRYGPGTRNTFGGHALDAMLILKPALERTLKRGFLPDNVGGFRRVLRDEIEAGTKEVIGITGVFTMSPKDHMGLDERAAVMIRIQGNTWTRVPTLR
ncbi:MAG: ABC transporter substrate-binding protein [Armatimonadota bacterium]